MSHARMMILSLATAILVPLWACDDETTGPEDTQASLSIYLTDAAGEVEAVWVELLGLTVQGGEGGPVELLSEPTDLVLLTDLVGTVQLLGVTTDLDPTTFSQLRLVVGDAVLKSSEGDGRVYVKGDPILPAGLEEFQDDLGELQCPSCPQSGIKVKVPNDELVVGDGSSALVLDFDVAQSFGHKAGKSGKWVMHPVIHGTLVGDENGDGEVLDDLGFARTIEGTVTLQTDLLLPDCPPATPTTLQDFVPLATLNGFLDGDGNPIVRSGTVMEGGTFSISYLPAASFSLGFVESIDLGGTHTLSFGATVNPAAVDLTVGDATGVSYEITSATCTEVSG